MTAVEIIARVHAAGGEVDLLDADRIIFRYRSRIPDELVAAAKACKPDIVQALSDPWIARARQMVVGYAERIVNLRGPQPTARSWR